MNNPEEIDWWLIYIGDLGGKTLVWIQESSKMLSYTMDLVDQLVIFGFEMIQTLVDP